MGRSIADAEYRVQAVAWQNSYGMPPAYRSCAEVRPGQTVTDFKQIVSLRLLRLKKMHAAHLLQSWQVETRSELIAKLLRTRMSNQLYSAWQSTTCLQKNDRMS